MRFGLIVGETKQDCAVKRVRGEMVKIHAARGTHGSGLGSEPLHGEGVERDDRESRIFGANFFDVMKALKIPGVEIEGDGMPSATG